MMTTAKIPMLDSKGKIRLTNIPSSVLNPAFGTASGAQRGDIKFTRLNNGNPVFSVGAQNPAADAASPTTSGTIYWPWIVDARAALGAAALDEFYMYYSTDHEAVHANSGIWLATGPTELGPWTGRGRIYRDDTGGDQCETPSVIWVPEENLFFMYYQMAGVPGIVGQQSTLLATSPNGTTWTRVGVVLESRTSYVGLGHTGYFRPFRVGGQWYGYHLNGNGTSAFGISYSVDGRDWWIDSRPLEFGIDQTGNAKRVEWNTSDIVWWRGRYWWIGLISDFSSGLTPKDARISTAPISGDLRHILGVPKAQLFPVAGVETTDYRTTQAFVGRDGNLYLYYQTNGSFYVAVAERSAN